MSAKSKGTRRSLKEKRRARRKRNKNRYEFGPNKIIDRGPDYPLVKLVHDYQGMPKVSENIIDLAQPLLDALEDDAPDSHYQKAISCAVYCWNLAIVPDDIKYEMEQKMKANHHKNHLDTEWLDFSKQVVDMLVERKLTRFPDDNRFVLDYTVYWENKYIGLNVASVPFDQDQKNMYP